MQSFLRQLKKLVGYQSQPVLLGYQPLKAGPTFPRKRPSSASGLNGPEWPWCVHAVLRPHTAGTRRLLQSSPLRHLVPRLLSSQFVLLALPGRARCDPNRVLGRHRIGRAVFDLLRVFRASCCCSSRAASSSGGEFHQGPRSLCAACTGCASRAIRSARRLEPRTITAAAAKGPALFSPASTERKEPVR